MRIKAHVIELSDNGDMVTVKAQGNHERAPKWQGEYQPISFQIPVYAAKAYRIGTQLAITVTPR